MFVAELYNFMQGRLQTVLRSLLFWRRLKKGLCRLRLSHAHPQPKLEDCSAPFPYYSAMQIHCQCLEPLNSHDHRQQSIRTCSRGRPCHFQNGSKALQLGFQTRLYTRPFLISVPSSPAKAVSSRANKLSAA